MQIYFWKANRYKRNTPNSKWQLDETEKKLFTYDWGETLCSDEELRFWRNCGTCRHSRTAHGHQVTRISPDKMSKTVETSKIGSINCLGFREKEILKGKNRVLGDLINDESTYFDFDAKTGAIVG